MTIFTDPSYGAAWQTVGKFLGLAIAGWWVARKYLKK